MLPRARMSASAFASTASKVSDRWLISRIDMPTPGSVTRSRWISSSTGSGSTAGPAAKLKMRLTVGMSVPSAARGGPRLNRDQVQIEDVVVAVADLLQQRVGRRAVEVDARHRRLRPFEYDVLGLLHVDLALAQVVENVRQHARPIAMPDDEHVRRRRLLRKVDDVRHLAGVLVGRDDPDRLGGDGVLRLIGRRADVVGAVDVLERGDRVLEFAGAAGRLGGEDVEPDADIA